MEFYSLLLSLQRAAILGNVVSCALQLFQARVAISYSVLESMLKDTSKLLNKCVRIP